MAVDARDRAEDALGNGPSPEDQEQREKELKKLRERLEQHKAVCVYRSADRLPVLTSRDLHTRTMILYVMSWR